jgi:hypothetical protein
MKRYKQISIIQHSKEFLKILKEADTDKAIRAITHTKPLLVFWVSPEGKIIDAKEAHHDNPPNGDKSILSHKTHKGNLRGRAALIGDIIYIVIYGEGQVEINNRQLALLRRAYPNILRAIKVKNNILQDLIDTAIFINEIGDVISV